MQRLIFVLATLLLPICYASATTNDSIKHWGYAVDFNPSKIIVMDKYQRGFQKDKNNFSVRMEAIRQWLPSDSSAVAADYNYPSLSVSAKYSFNHGVTMHRTPNKLWRRRQEADYDTQMGNSIALFGTFTRPIIHHRKWEIDYSLSCGMAYSKSIYNPYTAIDNELIGSHLMIYFGLGTHVTYHATDEWGIRLGAEYWHISNGALDRPNKGANFIGPSLGVVYTPYHKELIKQKEQIKQQRKEGNSADNKEKFQPYIFMNVAAALGGKSLQEDWNVTYYVSYPTDNLYYRTKFPVYLTVASQIDLMFRYQRRWASGIGFDVFYGDYAYTVKKHDGPNSKSKYSPWSTGIALKHEVYFGQLLCQIGIGYYFHREMGHYAKGVEKPYYERVGVSYAFKQLGGLRLGFNVKAHFTKADYTELLLTMPIKLIQFKR